MSEAFQCDRCGDFQTGEPEESVPVKREKRTRERKPPQWATEWPKYETKVDTERMEAELCDECQERLANFLQGKLGFPDP
jgi:DNA-directed RNA polymerase subunit M/transcription elongation factor TFIIS